MAEESFLLVNLKESKSKELAQVISNETSRQILDFLSKKEATETEISNNLHLPLSTAHYNLQNLVKAGLVKVEEFHYSEKGKEVNHYKLSNKFIIIAPTVTETIKNRLKKILPVALIAVIASGFIQLYSSFSRGALEKAADATVLSAGARETVLEEAADATVPAAVQQPSIALWFFFGAMFAVALYLLIGLIKKK